MPDSKMNNLCEIQDELTMVSPLYHPALPSPTNPDRGDSLEGKKGRENVIPITSLVLPSFHSIIQISSPREK